MLLKKIRNKNINKTPNEIRRNITVICFTQGSQIHKTQANKISLFDESIICIIKLFMYVLYNVHP